MKSNLTKSVVALAGFALLYVLTRIPLVHVGERVVSCDSALAALLFKKGSFAYSLMKHLLSCIIPLITVAIVCKGKNILECWGLRRNFLKGWAVGLLCCIPMLVCNLIAGHVEFGWNKLFLGAVFAGLFEELIYRGFLFGVLHRYCGWRFIWAALPAAVLFTLGHFYQSHDFVSGLQVFCVTALGSLFFSWLYMVWDNNLWVPISFHIMMNGIWVLIPIADATSSVGSIAANIGRLLTVALAVTLTVLYKKREPQRVDFSESRVYALLNREAMNMSVNVSCCVTVMPRPLFDSPFRKSRATLGVYIFYG